MSLPREDDVRFMREALAEAGRAAAAGEVPVGAVVVRQGRIIGRGHNRSIGSCDASAHAEIEAMRQASQALGNYRLDDCELFVTLEPCLMCSGAVMGARIRRLVYGAAEPRTGAAGSVIDAFARPELNHHTQVQSGLLADECALSLQQFFQGRRQAQALHREGRFLRDDALRPPVHAVPTWGPGLKSTWLGDLPSLDGLRLHALSAGTEDASLAVLALHGLADWSCAWQPWFERMAGAPLSLAAPDLPGFGLSDHPKKASWHTPEKHVQALADLALRWSPPRLAVLAPPSMWPLAVALAAHPALAARLRLLACIPEFTLAPQQAALPYPHASHRTAQQVLPQLLREAAGTGAQPLPQGLDVLSDRLLALAAALD